MEKSDVELSETINEVKKMMESVGDSIKQGFGLMAEMRQTHHSGGLYPTYAFNYQSQVLTIGTYSGNIY